MDQNRIENEIKLEDDDSIHKEENSHTKISNYDTTFNEINFLNEQRNQQFYVNSIKNRSSCMIKTNNITKFLYFILIFVLMF